MPETGSTDRTRAAVVQAALDSGLFVADCTGRYLYPIAKLLSTKHVRDLAKHVYYLCREDLTVVMDRFNCPMWDIESVREAVDDLDDPDDPAHEDDELQSFEDHLRRD